MNNRSNKHNIQNSIISSTSSSPSSSSSSSSPSPIEAIPNKLNFTKREMLNSPPLKRIPSVSPTHQPYHRYVVGIDNNVTDDSSPVTHESKLAASHNSHRPNPQSHVPMCPNHSTSDSCSPPSSIKNNSSSSSLSSVNRSYTSGKNYSTDSRKVHVSPSPTFMRTKPLDMSPNISLHRTTSNLSSSISPSSSSLAHKHSLSVHRSTPHLNTTKPNSPNRSFSTKSRPIKDSSRNVNSGSTKISLEKSHNSPPHPEPLSREKISASPMEYSQSTSNSNDANQNQVKTSTNNNSQSSIKLSSSQNTSTNPNTSSLDPKQQSSGSSTGGPKLISRNFFECSTYDIIVLVSSMLQELVILNDALPFDAQHLTRFHSRSHPPISLRDYLIRIAKFCSLEKSAILAIIYYIDLLCTTFKIFNINSLTVHRFLITAAMVASKGLSDTFCTNTHYAKVGGLSRAELNSLEIEFLIRVDYRIVPPVERLDQYFERMVMRIGEKYKFNPNTTSQLELQKMNTSQHAASTKTPYLDHPQPSSENIDSRSSSDSSSNTNNSNSATTLERNKSTHGINNSNVVLPSEVSIREGRNNLSSNLKRSSIGFEEDSGTNSEIVSRSRNLCQPTPRNSSLRNDNKKYLINTTSPANNQQPPIDNHSKTHYQENQPQQTLENNNQLKAIKQREDLHSSMMSRDGMESSSDSSEDEDIYLEGDDDIIDSEDESIDTDIETS